VRLSFDGHAARHLAFNGGLRKTGHFIEAEALEPARTTTGLRVRNGKLSVNDGPFTETKELVAGFYLIEARDMNEAVQLAARIPRARRAQGLPLAVSSGAPPGATATGWHGLSAKIRTLSSALACSNSSAVRRSGHT